MLIKEMIIKIPFDTNENNLYSKDSYLKIYLLYSYLYVTK